MRNKLVSKRLAQNIINVCILIKCNLRSSDFRGNYQGQFVVKNELITKLNKVMDQCLVGYREEIHQAINVVYHRKYLVRNQDKLNLIVDLRELDNRMYVRN